MIFDKEGCHVWIAWLSTLLELKATPNYKTKSTNNQIWILHANLWWFVSTLLFLFNNLSCDNQWFVPFFPFLFPFILVFRHHTDSNPSKYNHKTKFGDSFGKQKHHQYQFHATFHFAQNDGWMPLNITLSCKTLILNGHSQKVGEIRNFGG